MPVYPLFRDITRVAGLIAAALLLYAAYEIFAAESVTREAPAPQISDTGFLWLVNTDNPLPASYVPDALTEHANGIRLHPAAEEAFTQLLAAMKANGICGISLHSAYRPYDRQQMLFSRKVTAHMKQGNPRETAQTLAAQLVQPPGASEHQLGLALDVSNTYQLTQAFGNTPAGEWLAVNAHRFGFIIRYPQAKTHTTRIVYEPWHLRYVGIPHAEIMHERGLTLEEYADFIAAHSPYPFWENADAFYLIYCFDAPPDPPLPHTVSMSADRFGAGARYVVTVRKQNPLIYISQPD